MPPFNLNNAANMAQFINLILLMKDASNNDLMKELNRQNVEFLTKIIEQNEIIIKQNEKLLNILGDENVK